MKAGGRSKERSSWLAGNQSWVLMGWGVVLVALASVFSERSAVASIFAFTGVASFVLGVLAERIEGDFELSATGLKGRLRDLADRDDLTLEEKGDEAIRLVDPPLAERDAASLISGDARGRATLFESQVKAWFLDHGWTVGPEAPTTDTGFDLEVQRGGDRRLVEAKAVARLSSADIHRFIDKARKHSQLEAVPYRFFLAVPSISSLTEAAREALSANRELVELLEIPR